MLDNYHELNDLFSELQERRKSGLDVDEERNEDFSEEHSRLNEMISTFDPELAKARVRESMTPPPTTTSTSGTERTTTEDLCASAQATGPPAKKKRCVDLQEFLREHLPQVRLLITIFGVFKDLVGWMWMDNT